MNKYVILLLFNILPLAIQGQKVELKRQIEKILKYDSPVDFNVVPGILIGVIDKDSLYQISFGKDIYADGIYELGSVTKPFVAWLVVKALDSLGLTVNEPICTFIPDSLCTSLWKKISVEDILIHHSGLQRMPPEMGEMEADIKNPYATYALSNFVADITLLRPVSGLYSYSNIAYAMLHWIFESVGGLDYFADKILLHSCHFSTIKFDMTNEKIAPGYGMDGRPQPPWNANALNPAIGLKSSMPDLLRFLEIQLRLFEADPVLQTRSFRKEVKSLVSKRAYKVINGWFVINEGKKIIFYHTGRTGGHQVSVAFMPHSHQSVAIISNGALGSDDLVFMILRMLRRSHPAHFN